MLSETLHKQVFGNEVEKYSSFKVKASIEHLKQHNLWGKVGTIRKEVKLDLPKLQGANIDEHFKFIAKKQLEPYLSHVHLLVSTEVPEPPNTWVYRAGWTKYDDGGPVPIPYPDSDALVFDVEVCVPEGNLLGLNLTVLHKYNSM